VGESICRVLIITLIVQEGKEGQCGVKNTIARQGGGRGGGSRRNMPCQIRHKENERRRRKEKRAAVRRARQTIAPFKGRKEDLQEEKVRK